MIDENATTHGRVRRGLVASYYEEYSRQFVAEGAARAGRVHRIQRPSQDDQRLWRVHYKTADGVDKVLTTSAVVLAGGMYGAPLRLGIDGENLEQTHHRAPPLPSSDRPATLVVVG